MDMSSLHTSTTSTPARRRTSIQPFTFSSVCNPSWERRCNDGSTGAFIAAYTQGRRSSRSRHHAEAGGLGEPREALPVGSRASDTWVLLPEPAAQQLAAASACVISLQVSAIFDFSSLITVLLLLICTCTYLRGYRSAIFDNSGDAQRHSGFKGLCWKFSRMGERVSPYVSAACLVMAVHILFIKQ